MKLTTRYQEKFLVTRYQTVKINEMALEMAQFILGKTVINELELVVRFIELVEEREIRLFVSRLLQVNALNLIEEVNHVAP